MSDQHLRSGGQLLVDCLVQQDVKRLFCVPGESYLDVLNALYDAPIETIICRQEGGAAMMADADGRLSGRPGICFVTRGPGATNASAGVHIAYQDSTPMILFIGQVARNMMEREAFQEIDYRQMFGPMAKWVAQIDDADRIPEFVSRAYHTAMSGRPGPVVLALPEDMLIDQIAAKPCSYVQAIRPGVSQAQLEQVRAELLAARKPLVVLGGGGWTHEAHANIRKFAETWDLPVGVTFRCQDYMNHDSSSYVGDIGIGINPKLAERVKSADLLLVIGAKLGEMTTSGYDLVNIPSPQQRLIHVLAGAEEIGRVYQPALGINADQTLFIEALADLETPEITPWSAERAQARADFETWRIPPTVQGSVQMGEIMTYLGNMLGSDAIFTNGAGNYSTWGNRFYTYRKHKTMLGPTSGSMGYGTPASIAAKLAHPEKTVIAYAGDGCFMMHGQELATAVQYGVNIIIIVINNGMYGTIRMHQEREYPARISGTRLQNPNFSELARAYGAHGELVETTEEFYPAFDRVLNAGIPALIEIRIDPEVITPSMTLSDIRQAAENK